MIQLVAIDPGLSTGVAVIHSDGTAVSFTTVAPHDELDRFLDKLDENVNIVCEQGPRNRRQADACTPVEARVKQLANPIHWVRPTDWKPNPHARLEPSDKPGTKHERDATRMGRWFKARRGDQLVEASVTAS